MCRETICGLPYGIEIKVSGNQIYAVSWSEVVSWVVPEMRWFGRARMDIHSRLDRIDEKPYRLASYGDEPPVFGSCVEVDGELIPSLARRTTAFRHNPTNNLTPWTRRRFDCR